MKIEVLVSTMNLKNHEELIKNMNISESVVINQTQKIELEDVKSGKNRLYNYQEKGLSRSRNRAIENSNADICVIADDDVRYVDNYKTIIEEGYKKYPDADIIAFYVDNIDKNRHRPIHSERKINFITSMQIKSQQITFKRKSIIENNIRFDENFGTGTDLFMGEENIFLTECIKKGLKIYYIPITTNIIQTNISTWFNGHNERFFNVKGAVYYRISKILSNILILQFAIRKYRKYKKEINLINAIKYMFIGKRNYKKSIKKKIYFMGDFCLNTGPAIVNKSYYPYVADKCYICKTNNKPIRVLHFIIYIWKCDSLLISSLSKFHLQSAKFAKAFNKKVLYLMHGYGKLEYEANEITKEKGKMLEVENGILNTVDTIICVSEQFSELLKKDRADLQNKITFVNNGIDKINIEHKRNNNNNTYTIISIGGGKPLKNILYICKAIEKIEDIKIKFIVIGEKNKYGESIKEFNFVEYYETLQHDEVLEKLQESDLYIQNSTIETFCLAVVEAISAGCKIMVSKNVGALSIINNIEDYMIINNVHDVEEIFHKIKTIYKNRNLDINYIENYEKYSWQNESKILIDKCKEEKNENKE